MLNNEIKKKIHLIKGQKNDLLKNEIGKKIHLKKKKLKSTRVNLLNHDLDHKTEITQ
jgi:hypothetical protein